MISYKKALKDYNKALNEYYKLIWKHNLKTQVAADKYMKGLTTSEDYRKIKQAKPVRPQKPWILKLVDFILNRR